MNHLEHWLPEKWGRLRLKDLEWWLTCDYQSVNTFSASYYFDSEEAKDMVLRREIKQLKQHLQKRIDL